MTLRLPNEVIDDILVWLPVKDILRFRCLSKCICTTMDGPRFVATHLNRSLQAKSHRKLVFSGPIHSLHEYNYNGIDLDYDEIHRGIQLNSPLKVNNDGNRFLASCNGTVLSWNGVDNDIVLWNPFTRRWKKAPFDYYPYLGIGLGYDCATNNYKIATIQRVLPPHHQSLRPPLYIKVMVFDVASNTSSTSEVVEIPFPANTSVENDVSVEIASVGEFAMGALHWILHSWEYKHVLSLDIATQKFVNMLPPLPPPSSHDSRFSLQVLQGHILLCGGEKWYGQIVELFEVVDEGKGLMSWRKLCIINRMELSRMTGRNPKFPILEDVKLLDYSKDGNKMLLQYPASGHTANGSPYLSHLFWYDFRRGTYKHARISHHRSSRSLRSRCEATFCFESLVSLGADAQFDGSVSGA